MYIWSFNLFLFVIIISTIGIQPKFMEEIQTFKIWHFVIYVMSNSGYMLIIHCNSKMRYKNSNIQQCVGDNLVLKIWNFFNIMVFCVRTLCCLGGEYCLCIHFYPEDGGRYSLKTLIPTFQITGCVFICILYNDVLNNSLCMALNYLIIVNSEGCGMKWL